MVIKLTLSVHSVSIFIMVSLNQCFRHQHLLLVILTTAVNCPQCYIHTRWLSNTGIIINVPEFHCSRYRISFCKVILTFHLISVTAIQINDIITWEDSKQFYFILTPISLSHKFNRHHPVYYSQSISNTNLKCTELTLQKRGRFFHSRGQCKHDQNIRLKKDEVAIVENCQLFCHLLFILSLLNVS